MLTFFVDQLDYVYFFYGLSFIFLGLICLLLLKNERKEMPWVYLAFFGILHGLNEWTDLLQIVFPGRLWLEVLRIALLFSGFILLFEFGRRAVDPEKKMKYSIWMYPVILVFLFVGFRSGSWDEFGLSVRYSFGAIGAILSGIAFWRFSFAKNANQMLFQSGALAFWIYAILQFASSQSTFFLRIGLPLPLIRGILATVIFLCVWFQFQFSASVGVTGKEKNGRRLVTKKQILSFLFLLLIILIAGGVFVNALGYQAKNEIHVESNNIMESISTNVRDTISFTNHLTETLSLSLRVKNYFEEKDHNQASINAVLDEHANIIGDSVCYIMDKNGTVIATSNRNASDSFYGKNYAFRSYFMKAIRDEPASLFAIGVTSKRPGYYAAEPVKNERGEIMGVVVVKINLDELDETFAYHHKMFLVSPEGVVFLSGDPSLKGKSISPISPSLKQTLLKDQLYGESDFSPIFANRISDNSKVILNQQPFLAYTKQMNNDGWSVVYLHPFHRVYYYRLFGIICTLLFYIFFISFLVMIQMIKKNAIFSYFASVVTGSQDAIVGKDLNGVVMTWNKGAEKVYGYSKEEIIGESCEILLPESEVEKNRKMLKAVQGGKVFENFEMKHIQKDGQSIDVSVTISPIKDVEERIVGVSMVVRDISRLKKLEKIKSEFVSIASHQLRTPLTGIKWFSELLLNDRDTTLSNHQRDYLQQIAESNQRMIGLVNDMLEVSHIDDKGSYVMNKEKEDFSQIIKSVVEQQTVVANMKQVKILLDPNCLKPTMLMIDAKKMEQVVQNILGNAIKFSLKDNVVSVTCKKQKGQLICSVQDHGMGIPTQQQSRIFEKFYRADNSVDAGSGTGLGLYIAKSIVEAHGGSIWFESEEGKGTTFYFSLPMAEKV